MASSWLIVDRARAQYDYSERFGTTRTVAHFFCGVAGWREFQDAEVEVLRWLASSKGRLAYGRPESGAKYPSPQSNQGLVASDFGRR
jgi:hypothetical protein